MCRLLIVHDREPFALTPFLQVFAAMARESIEWQGDGWGCAWRAENSWHEYHALTPVWEDDLSRFGSSNLLLVHARSAFRNEGIVLENTMPFFSGERVFIFNGELRGVRLSAPGRIGAEKLMNVLLAGEGPLDERISRGLRVVHSRSRYVRAMNFAIADGDTVHIHGEFGESPDYFTLWKLERGSRTMISSMPLAGLDGWQPLTNPCEETIEC